jgi:catechol 2,3-dioxygenase-like lactoylglutathione lyase family enzyme
MDWKLELVAVPVSDVDRAKAFYTEKVGFNADHDHTVSDELRFVQLTPPGSACSIAIGRGIVESQPGSVRRLYRPRHPPADPKAHRTYRQQRAIGGFRLAPRPQRTRMTSFSYRPARAIARFLAPYQSPVIRGFVHFQCAAKIHTHTKRKHLAEVVAIVRT